MRVRLLLVPALVVLIAAAGWLAFRGGEEPSGAASVAEHPVAVPESERTVYLAAALPQPSASARTLSALVERGAMPTAPTMAEVLTDTECTPDAQMISKCRNEVMLPNGHKLVLRHPHRMSDVPCLAPGEQVRLVPPAL